MKPEIPNDLQRQAAAWGQLSRQERSEFGKELRRLGLTQTEIRALIPVPKSTLSYWCRDVELTTEQIDAIRRRSSSQAGLPRDTQRKRREEIVRIRHTALETAPYLFDDPRFTAGVALYWAEGAKAQSDLTLANADPALLRTFISWVRGYLDPRAEFRLSLHIHAGNDEGRARR